MPWTCTECGTTEPFDPPRRTDTGDPLCESCDDVDQEDVDADTED